MDANPTRARADGSSRPTAEGWDRDSRGYPYWDDRIGSMVYAHHGDFLVSVTPMIFNDRVLLTSRADYPDTWTAGFCYDKGPAAGLAAMAWDPTRDPRPAGFKKVAADNRHHEGEPE